MSNSFVTLWTVTHLSMGFPRQEYCSGVAISFCRWSSWLRDRTHVSCIVGRFFTTEPPGKTIHTHTPGPGANPLQILRGHCTPGGWEELDFPCILFGTSVLLNYPVGPCDVAGTQCSTGLTVEREEPGEKGPLCAMPIRPNLSAQRQSKELSKMLPALRLCYLSGSVIFFLLLQKSASLVHFKLPLILNGGFSAPWIHPWGGSHWSLLRRPPQAKKTSLTLFLVNPCPSRGWGAASLVACYYLQVISRWLLSGKKHCHRHCAPIGACHFATKEKNRVFEEYIYTIHVLSKRGMSIKFQEQY